MFFALSGFLITGSALRLKLKDFLLNRGMRIIPALAVDIFVSALVIGPIYTTTTIPQYFTQYEFRAYFANVLGVIHYTLPGVFENNPFPQTVNGSLWTIPFEIGCYGIMSAFIFFGILKRPIVCLLIVVTICIVLAGSVAAKLDPLSAGPLKNALVHFFKHIGLQLYAAFAVGILAYIFRYQIPFSPIAGAICVLAVVGATNTFPAMHSVLLFTVVTPALVYVTVQTGLTRMPTLPFFSTGDYSYGVYLYGYPIQQALVATFPELTSPVLHFLCAAPLTIVVAAASWWVVEKPVLRLRRKFSFTARKGDGALVVPKPGTVGT
jgi:peptidoglycan/LPS O-acetylase OafA/YrhL